MVKDAVCWSAQVGVAEKLPDAAMGVKPRGLVCVSVEYSRVFGTSVRFSCVLSRRQPRKVVT